MAEILEEFDEVLHGVQWIYLDFKIISPVPRFTRR